MCKSIMWLMHLPLEHLPWEYRIQAYNCLTWSKEIFFLDRKSSRNGAWLRPWVVCWHRNQILPVTPTYVARTPLSICMSPLRLRVLSATLTSWLAGGGWDSDETINELCLTPNAFKPTCMPVRSGLCCWNKSSSARKKGLEVQATEKINMCSFWW